MNNGRKVLIVKTGFSEFLDRGISTTVSLGDVLTCTAILHLYKNDQVTWMTSWGARHLLENNSYIQELLIFGPEALRKIMVESSYDVLVNLEKDIGICTILRAVKSKKRFGFYFNDQMHDISTHIRSTRYLLDGQENHRDLEKSFLEILFESVGEQWQGQGFMLGERRRMKERYDVGLNYFVGAKWPTKAWPQEKWKDLELLLKDKHIVSWQQGHKDLQKYIDWIDSCKVIVTSDSLGQALGLALDKKVIALYGPTNSRRMKDIKNLFLFNSELPCPHIPCYLPICKNDRFCMDFIAPEKIASKCEEILGSVPALALSQKEGVL